MNKNYYDYTYVKQGIYRSYCKRFSPIIYRKCINFDLESGSKIRVVYNEYYISCI